MGLNGIAAATAALVLAACGGVIAEMHGLPVVDPHDSTSVRQHVAILPNPHRGLILIEGPLVFHDGNVAGKTYAVRTWVAADRPDLDGRFQIHVTAPFERRAYLKQAYSRGRQLETMVLDRAVVPCPRRHCPVTETIGINLTDGELAEALKDGIAFEIVGRRETIVMAVPAPYFSAVHAAYRAAKPSGA
jgi:hypothetical protein